jgi:outer membrane protein OmpA-like peptidoglycan-associated protein
MKKILLSIILASCFIHVYSQNKARPNGISFKALLKDYQSQNGGALDAIKDYHYGFEIGYHRYLADRLYLNIPFKYGNVNSTSNSPISENFKQIASLDAQLQYHFVNPENKVSAYALAGAGGVQEIRGLFNAQVPVGLGVNFKIAHNAFINIQSEYRFAFEENRNNLHHGLGFIFYPGHKEEKVEEVLPDSDGDGVSDKLDICPDIPGLPQFNGCPDTDGDGVPDYQDKCPKVPGLTSLDGCPDTDGDGVPDNEDECPSVPGPKDNKGCPVKVMDKDGDGVPDNVDKCPDVAGPASNNGCPEPPKVSDKDGDGIPDNVDKCPDKPGPKIYDGCPDTDGDGVPDHLDKCPNTKGPVSNNGCPEISTEDKKTLDVAMRAVQFETGKATLKQESYGILKQVANILNRYPDYNVMINGHTDNVGSPVANQELSEKRAKACLEYLVLQGIVRTRMNSIGYGESRPISDNNTEIGRSLNRRVEFTLIPR